MRKFYGQFEPPVDRFISERYFPEDGIRGVFVECGAYDGLTECSCKFFEESMGWTGYNFEPVPWIFDKLSINRPLSKNLNFALSNVDGEANFKAVDHPQFGRNCTNGSLTHTSEHTKWLEEEGCAFVDVTVKLRTWRDFVVQENVAHVDLLVLDVEGHELSVIDGMKGSSVLPDVICIEVGHLKFDEIRQRLASFGYVYDISSHVNAFFVKADRLALFAHRRARAADVVARPDVDVAMVELIDVVQHRLVFRESECERLQEEVNSLRGHVSSLNGLLHEITQSKAWKFVEFVRKFRRA